MSEPILISFFLLVVLDALISMTRACLLNARPAHLLILREQQPEAVDRALAAIQRPRLRVSLRVAAVLDRLLAAGLLLFWFDGQYGQSLLPQARFWIGMAILFVFGVLLLALEYFIEGRVLRKPEIWAVRMAPLGIALDTLFTPISALMMTLMDYSSLEKNAAGVTEDELKTWVEKGRENGSLEKGERKMIYSIFHFGDTLAREIMVPRIDIYALEMSQSLAEAYQALAQSGHSRVPVYEETIDQIVGLLYAKDLIGVRLPETTPLSSLREMLRPAYFVPEAKKVDELLTEIQTRRIHMAIVVDEYGGVAGLVTLEDIMEEIVGEIQDEYDQVEEMLYQEVSPNEYIFLGRTPIDDFNEVMGTHLPNNGADTLGGFIFSEIGRVPAGGETIQTEEVILTVEQVTGRRIRKVRARKIQPEEEMQKEQSDAE
ncbi:MAG TPA: hemolysin family protein [Anaerolineaceae bacterium]|nr:hemolysin family protein [Anaerolineaceae bacterium]